MKLFTLDGLQQKYGIRRATVNELIKAGLVEPQRGSRREYRFSFHDVVLLRMAQDLHGEGVSARRLTRFLKQLAQTLPMQSAAGMRLTTAGRELVVRQDGRLRNSQGQLVLDFSQADGAQAIAALPAKRRLDAHGHFDRAEELAQEDAAAAAEHYRQAVELDPGLLDAWINLSCVLLEAEQAIEAYAAAQEGLLHHPRAALLHYNLALAQEAMQQDLEALASYRQALAHDPQLLDAHFNAAHLAERLGRAQDAIRHFNAWRRSQVELS
jgi:tetratricopeptide (TPR) repeat protein